MNLFYRGLAAGACALGLVVLAAGPGDLSAQPKKDAKVDPKKADPKKADPKKGDPKPPVANPEDKGKTDVTGSFPTQDGLGIRRYWYSAGKGSADAVLLFPAPGNKVNDAWRALGRALQREGFSVMLFDWRGCGENGPDRPGGPERILLKPEAYEKDPLYSSVTRLATIEKKGLNWTTMSPRAKDTVLYDLMGARYALDKQNDAGQCNTNRIWIVSEGVGCQLGLAWIAAESHRNTNYVKANRFDDKPPPFTPASLDYIGLVCLSYNTGNPTAARVYESGLASGARYTKETNDHLDRRLAMVMVHSKKEGAGNSKGVVGKYVSLNDPAEMRKKFKYLMEIDTSSIPKDIKGIELMAEADPFSARKSVVEAMVKIRDAADQGKERQTRDTQQQGNDPPLFEIGRFKIR